MCSTTNTPLNTFICDYLDLSNAEFCFNILLKVIFNLAIQLNLYLFYEIERACFIRSQNLGLLWHKTGQVIQNCDYLDLDIEIQINLDNDVIPKKH